MTDKPPKTRLLIAAVVVGVVLFFGAIFIAVTDTPTERPEPTITGE